MQYLDGEGSPVGVASKLITQIDFEKALREFMSTVSTDLVRINASIVAQTERIDSLKDNFSP